MEQTLNNDQMPESCLASVGSSAFLLEAVKAVTVYKTPQKILDYVEKHQHDCLIQNPPYDTARTQ